MDLCYSYFSKFSTGINPPDSYDKSLIGSNLPGQLENRRSLAHCAKLVRLIVPAGQNGLILLAYESRRYVVEKVNVPRMENDSEKLKNTKNFEKSKNF